MKSHSRHCRKRRPREAGRGEEPRPLACRLCGCRLVRWRTVNRWRTVVYTGQHRVAWQTPLGTTVSAPFATRDHILPKRVKSSLTGNQQLLCGGCHARKTAVDRLQFGDDPEWWDSCIECGELLSWGPQSCTVCHLYRGAPIVGWLVRTGRVTRGPRKLAKVPAAATRQPRVHTSEAVPGDRISAL